MKALIIYISVHHGNTERVAKVMADILDADLLKVKQVDASMLEQYDLIGFGSGIYFGKHHKSLLDFADKLPMLRNKKAFIFSTIGQFSCRGFDTSWAAMIVGGINRDRPNTKDLKQAKYFARGLKDGG